MLQNFGWMIVIFALEKNTKWNMWGSFKTYISSQPIAYIWKMYPFIFAYDLHYWNSSTYKIQTHTGYL
jgi:sterol desaturase/sphingolipid hydroxylase (fatty acid hydroxylase superfamily)